AWLDETPKRRERLSKRLSKKQLDKLKESAIGFNNWLRKTGEAPVIVSEDQAEKSIKRMEAYYTNNGCFDVKALYDIHKKENKRAEVVYNVETGTPFVLDTITEKIKSPIIDSLRKNKKEQFNQTKRAIPILQLFT